MTPLELLTLVIIPALAQLPLGMDSVRARIMLVAIALQESRIQYRRQLGNGPARGLWQFELGSIYGTASGKTWGIYVHPATRGPLMALCALHKVAFQPLAIHAELEKNDIFACGVARLLLWSDAQGLPDIDDPQGAWKLYAERTWRPGKPHPETWAKFHAQAVATVTTYHE